jgi:hypothetical protein
MNKVFGIDMDTWTALNAIGAILSALGTLAAVIVALRLARRDYMPHLSISNSIMQTVDPAPDAKPIELVTITGTNLGHAPINVKGIFWTFGWFRRQRFLTVVPYNSPGSDPLPKEITHSQQVFLVQPLAEFSAGLDTFVLHLKERWYRRFLIRSFRCGLYTSNGDFSSRADVRIRELIKKAYDAKPQPKPHAA